MKPAYHDNIQHLYQAVQRVSDIVTATYPKVLIERLVITKDTPGDDWEWYFSVTDS